MYQVSYLDRIAGVNAGIACLRGGLTLHHSLNEGGLSYESPTLSQWCGRKVLHASVGLWAAVSWLVAWTHEVGLSCLGRGFTWCKGSAFGAFSVTYITDAKNLYNYPATRNPLCQMGRSLQLIGKISLVVWALSGLGSQLTFFRCVPMMEKLLFFGGTGACMSGEYLHKQGAFYAASTLD